MWPSEENRRAFDARFGPDEDRRLPAELPDVAGKHVLHLGCRRGSASEALHARGALVTALDVDESDLAAARERAPDALFVRGRIDDIPLEQRRGRFDLVYADEVLSAVADLTAFAQGVAAALKAGGTLLLVDEHPAAICVDPIDLRWREDWFALPALGPLVTALAAHQLVLERLEERPALPPRRLDSRVPATYLLVAIKAATARA